MASNTGKPPGSQALCRGPYCLRPRSYITGPSVWRVKARQTRSLRPNAHAPKLVGQHEDSVERAAGVARREEPGADRRHLDRPPREEVACVVERREKRDAEPPGGQSVQQAV